MLAIRERQHTASFPQLFCCLALLNSKFNRFAGSECSSASRRQTRHAKNVVKNERKNCAYGKYGDANDHKARKN